MTVSDTLNVTDGSIREVERSVSPGLSDSDNGSDDIPLTKQGKGKVKGKGKLTTCCSCPYIRPDYSRCGLPPKAKARE